MSTSRKSSKAKPGADAKKRLKKILTAIRDREAEREEAIVGELRELLDAHPEAIADVDALRMLPNCAESDMLAAFELLLGRGADPRVRVESGGVPCLGSLMLAGKADDDAKVLALAEQMIARGADPDERGDREGPLDSAANHSLARVDMLIRLGASEASALAALPGALRRLPRSPDKVAPIVERLLAHLSSVDAPGPDGLSALHLVALRGTPALLGATLDRSADPGHPVAALSGVSCDGCSPPGGGLIPVLQVTPGFTALDLAVEAHAVYAAAVDWYGDEGYDAKGRRERADALAANAALLAARGVPHGVADRGELPRFITDVDALLGRLCAHVGGDLEILRRRAAAIPSQGVGPFSYASTLLERAGSILLRSVVAERRGDSWIAHLIAGDHRRYLHALSKTPERGRLDPSRYPAEAQRPIKAGLVVGGRGDAALLVWAHAEGVARLGVAAPGSFTVLGDDFFAFLRAELIALGVAIDDIAVGPSVGPGGGLYRLLKADAGRPPEPGAVSRVGGRPIGFDAASWPRRGGAPMHHVLTLDLRDHPTFQPRGVRALALFISSPMGHEAYRPGNDHARVVLLSDADLARGEPPWPPELADADTLTATGLRLESAAGLPEDELFRHSFAGIAPLWLQGDDTEDGWGEDEYDDDGDGDGDDERGGSPGTFVLQFDEALVPGLNLGDCGVMYVFSGSAWFQCH